MAPASPIAEDEGASTVGIGLAVVFLLVGLIVGFLVGVRARQLITAVKNIPQATVSLKDVMKMQSRPADDGGETEKVEEDETGEEEVGDLMDRFMSTDVTNGLDDHPDTVRSPIVMYHIKVAKDEARREKRKQAMIAEGMDEEDAERLLLDEAAGGGMFGGAVNGDGTRMNALATLISVGARVTSAGNAQSAEAAAAEERRRHARTIDTFLQKQRGIDTSKTQPVKSTTRKNAADALETALQTKIKPYGGHAVERSAEAAKVAKTGRRQLKELGERREKAGIITPGQEVEMKRREATAGNLQGLSAADQMALLAELAAEEGSDGEDEEVGMMDLGGEEDGEEEQPVDA